MPPAPGQSRALARARDGRGRHVTVMAWEGAGFKGGAGRMEGNLEGVGARRGWHQGTQAGGGGRRGGKWQGESSGGRC